MDSLIRWTKKDRSRLDSAIKEFNREVNKLSKMDVDVPDKQSYKYLVQHITTRRELENVISNLKEYNEITGTQTVELTSGEKVSLYEYNDITKKKEIAERNLYTEMNKIQNERLVTQNKYMGEERITEIQETLESLMDYTKNAENFGKASKRLVNIGRTDYELAKQKLFKENFLKSLESAKNFDNYKALKKELNRYRDPRKFYDYVKKSPFLMDIFLWYKSTDGYLVYSSFDSNENAFDNALVNDLGINVSVD